MDIDLSKEQKLIKTSAREFLEKEFPKDFIRELEESEQGYSRELWEKMAELGWMAMNIPEEYDGMGMSYLDLIVLLEETGYNILPGPFFSTVMGAFPIIDGGSNEQKHEFLPKISSGELKVTFALTEPNASFNPSDTEVEAVSEGEDFIVNGTKLFVENAHIADYLICLVRTERGENPETALSLFLIDSKSPGMTINMIPAMSLDKQSEVIFKGVRVPKSNMLGRINEGWQLLQNTLAKAQVGKCAEMLGGMQASLDMTNAYVKKRMTYGRSVGSYQVVQHYLANIWIDVETSRNITYLAAWKINEGLPFGKEVGAAKAWVGKAFTRATERCIQMHGAIGLTREHDIGLYYRSAKAWDLAFGDGTYQKNIIAKEMNF
jgi:alkylation response protein AidB-like acyl-CoA dehydrogenase